jgi:hypothetical protein
MAAWSTEPSLSFLFFPVVNNEIILKKGWSVWMKYSPLFQGKTFCLRATPHFNGSSTAIYLINRVTTSIVIENHLDVFKKYLGTHITTNDILKGLENDLSVLDQTLLGNEELLGILLGFGAMNAQQFQKFSELTKIKNRTPIFPKQLCVTQADDPWERKIQRLGWKNKYDVNHPSRAEIEPETVAKQLMAIKWERRIKNDDPLAQISLPAFRRIENEQESERLIRAYRMTRPKIISVLNSQDFLKIVLSELSK